MQTLGDIIKAKGARQNALAALCGVSAPLFNKWAKRRGGIPVRALRPLATALGVTIDEIIDVADPIPNSQARKAPNGKL